MTDNERISYKMIERLFKAQNSVLLSFATSFVHDPDVAQDIVSDSFISLIEHRDSVDLSDYKAYLFAIVRNKSLTYRRDNTRHQDILERIKKEESAMMEVYTTAIENANLSLVHADEIRRLYREQLNKFSPLTRLIFTKSRHDGMTHKEIAAELGVSENTVRYEISKAMTAFRAALADYDEFIPLILLILSNLKVG